MALALTVRRPDINFGDVLRRRAILGFRFGLHPIDPPKFHEVVDIEISEVGLHRIEDFRDRDPEGFGTVAVDRGVQSRRGHPKAGADAADRRVLLGLGHELLGHGCKFLEIPAARILDLDGEPARRAEATDRRRVEGQYDRVAEFPEFFEGPSDQRLRMELRILPFIPGLERHEGRRHVGPAGIEDEILTDQCICAVYGRTREKKSFDFVHHGERSVSSRHHQEAGRPQ